MMQMKNELYLNQELYSEKMIREAIYVYKGLAKILVLKEEQYWVCKFDDCIYGLERTKKEFENYLIQLWNQSRSLS